MRLERSSGRQHDKGHEEKGDTSSLTPLLKNYQKRTLDDSIASQKNSKRTRDRSVSDEIVERGGKSCSVHKPLEVFASLDILGK